MSTAGRLKRIVWGMSSQTMASAVSLSLTVMTARSVSSEEYGVFALAHAAILFGVLLIRSLTAEVMVFQHSAETIKTRSITSSACLSASLVLSLVGALAFLCIGVLANSLLWLILSVSFIGLVVQDGLRYILIARQQVRTASALDLLSLILTVGLLLLASRAGNVEWFVSAWGAAAWVCALTGAIILRPKVTFAFAREWLRIGRGQSKHFGSEFLLSNVVETGTVFFVASFLGAAAAGHIRAASVLIFPVLLLTRGALLAVAAESNRMVANRRFHAARSIAFAMSFSTVAAALVLIPIVEIVPSNILTFLLGETAMGAAEVFPFVAIAAAATGLGSGPSLILKSAGWVRITLIGKAIALPFSAISVVILSMLAGAEGSQLGLAVGEVLRAAWSFFFMWRWLRSVSSMEKASEEVVLQRRWTLSIRNPRQESGD